VQAKLLRTLQNGEIQRLGADRPRHVDVRIIAATNRRLREQVAAGSFRADLYHRLSVYPVPIPPLRERGSDVLLLAGRFLELNRARLGLRSLRLAPAAQEALARYRWPGNVRELEHVISRAALKALSQGARQGDIVTLGPALLDLDPGPAPPTAGSAAPIALASSPTPGRSLLAAVQDCQRQHIHAALAQHQGNWAQAARSLGLDASNLHKLAKRLGLKETLPKQ
jgi:anaerobic nitric oxide reductase transcription regulator